MSIDLQISENKILISAPYNTDFPDKAHKCNGKWNNDSKKWEFNKKDLENVRNALKESYGYDDTMNDIQTKIRITFLQDYTLPQGKDLIILGLVIAKVGYKELKYCAYKLCINKAPYYDTKKSNTSNHYISVNVDTVIEFSININLYKKKYAASKLRQNGIIKIEQIEEPELIGQKISSTSENKDLETQIAALKTQLANLAKRVNAIENQKENSIRTTQNRNAMDRMKRARNKLASKYGPCKGTHFEALTYYANKISSGIDFILPDPDDKIAQAELYRDLAKNI